MNLIEATAKATSLAGDLSIPRDSNDFEGLIAILMRNAEAFNSVETHPRKLIDWLKNEPDDLEFLLKTMGDYCPFIGAGTYFLSRC